MSENKNNKNLNYNYDNNGLLGGLLLATGVLIGAAATLLIKENRPKKSRPCLRDSKKPPRTKWKRCWFLDRLRFS